MNHTKSNPPSPPGRGQGEPVCVRPRTGRGSDPQTAIRAVLDHYSGQQFTYGHLDCIQLIAAYIHELTGDDYELSAPKYSSKEQAVKILADHGGLIRLIAEYIGPPIVSADKDEDELPWVRYDHEFLLSYTARPGDIAVLKIGPNLNTGIRTSYSWLTVDENRGFVWLRAPRQAIKALWRFTELGSI